MTNSVRSMVLPFGTVGDRYSADLNQFVTGEVASFTAWSSIVPGLLVTETGKLCGEPLQAWRAPCGVVVTFLDGSEGFLAGMLRVHKAAAADSS